VVIYLIDFRSVNDVGTNFFKGAGIAKYYDSDITFSVLAGIEHAVSNIDIQRTGLLLDINAIYRLDHNFTLKGGVHSGFKPTSLSDVYVKNPYIARELVIDHDYTQNSVWSDQLSSAHRYPGIFGRADRDR
jgi:hypothetical protein